MRRIGDYDGEYVKRSSPWGLGLKVVGILLAAGVVLTLAGLGFGWFKAGTDIISPTNVKAQWQFAYDYSESLNAIGGNWCTTKQAEDAETNPDAKLQRQTQRIAHEQNYNRVKAEYDASRGRVPGEVGEARRRADAGTKPSRNHSRTRLQVAVLVRSPYTQGPRHPTDRRWSGDVRAR